MQQDAVTVISSLFGVTITVLDAVFWIIVIALYAIALINRQYIIDQFKNLTLKVLKLITDTHIKEELPEDLGGKGGQTIELGDGEQLEFVLIPSRLTIWLNWSPPANPKRRNAQGEPAKGSPPLLMWLVMLPFSGATFTLIFHFIFVMVGQTESFFPSMKIMFLVVNFSLLLFIPIYWIYEWNRQHRRLVVTTFMAYIMVYKFFTREYMRSPNPLKLVEEVILSSTGSGESSIFKRIFFGWLNKFYGIGDAFMGSRVEQTSDFLRGYMHVNGVGEILTILNGVVSDTIKAKSEYFGQAMKATIAGMLTEATSSGSSLPGGQGSPIAESLQVSEILVQEFRLQYPGGGELNLMDPRIVGFTRWNLETGELKKEYKTERGTA